jgi:hypothetical protein
MGCIADVDAFVDEVLAELGAMANDATFRCDRNPSRR